MSTPASLPIRFRERSWPINRQGTTILVVEQNATVALGIANRGYVLQNGRIVAHDAADALLRADHIRRAYLGED